MIADPSVLSSALALTKTKGNSAFFNLSQNGWFPSASSLRVKGVFPK